MSTSQIIRTSHPPRITNPVGIPDDRSDVPTMHVGNSYSPQRATDNACYPVFERYEILGEIGRGGMGVVYKAIDRDLKRTVAIKMILNGTFAAFDALSRFRAETEAIGRLNHPNLVRIYETGHVDGRPYAVMEYIEGGTLSEHIAFRAFGPDEAARIVADLADGIESAHQKGVLHRDLKPANVLLNGAAPKIVDFGLAKLDGATDYTQTGDVIGTPNYMAPERVTGPKTAIGFGVDIYALGAILFELLTRHMPFEGALPVEVLRLVVEHDAPNVRTLCPGISRDLATICQKCLQKNPHKRYQTAGDLADDLRRYLRREPIHARPIGNIERVWRWSQRNPGIAFALMTIFVLLTGVAIASTLTAQGFRELASEREAALRNAEAAAEYGRYLQYQTTMATVATNLQLNNSDTAERALLSVPEKYRGWEWRYFAAQMDLAECVLEYKPEFLSSIVYSQDGRLVALKGAKVLYVYDALNYSWRDTIVSAETMNSCQFTPDSSALLCSFSDGNVKQYQLASKKWTTLQLPDTPNLKADSWYFAFSPSGKYLVLWRSSEKISYLVLHALTEASPPAQFSLRERIRHIRFTNDESSLVGISLNTLERWSVAERKHLSSRQLATAHNTHYALSPDGQRLAMSAMSPSHTIELWDLDNVTQITLLEGHSNTVNQLVFSDDSSRLLSGSMDENACIWDARRGRLLKVLHGHTQRINMVGFTPDGQTAITTSDDTTSRLWDTSTGQLIAALSGQAAPVYAFGYHPQTQRLATTSFDHKVYFWDLETIRRRQILGRHDNFVYGVTTHPTKPIIASSSWDGTVRTWDLERGIPLHSYRHTESVVSSVMYNTDGTRLWSVMRNDVCCNGALCEWSTLDHQLVQPRLCRGSYWKLETNSALSPDERWIVVGGENGFVNVWSTSSSKSVRYPINPKKPVTEPNTGAVAWHPNGHEFVSGNCDGSLTRWKIGKPESGHTWMTPGIDHLHDRVINHVAYSHDRRWLASAGSDRRVHIWDATTLQEITQLKHGSIIYHFAFHPTEARLVTACSDNSIRVWDTNTFQEIVELRGHSKYVHAVAFTANGHQLVSGSGDGTVRVWDTRPIKKFPPLYPSGRAGEP